MFEYLEQYSLVQGKYKPASARHRAGAASYPLKPLKRAQRGRQARVGQTYRVSKASKGHDVITFIKETIEKIRHGLGYPTPFFNREEVPQVLLLTPYYVKPRVMHHIQVILETHPYALCLNKMPEGNENFCIKETGVGWRGRQQHEARFVHLRSFSNDRTGLLFLDTKEAYNCAILDYDDYIIDKEPFKFIYDHVLGDG